MRVYSPYNRAVRDFATIANTFNRISEGHNYDYAAAGGNAGEKPERTLRLPLDVWTKDDTFVIQAYLPGVNADDVKITFEGEDLTISGDFPTCEEETEYVKRELFHGAFERTLTFNVPVEVDSIEAVFENGLLTLNVPKAEVARPKEIKIQAR